MKKATIICGLLSLIVMFGSCGDATVEPANESYEPRIVIEGYLEAGKNIEKIQISRNFPLNADLSKVGLLPDPDKSIVQVTDLENDHIYDLTFKVDDHKDLNGIYWTYEGSDLTVQEGKTYQLDVWTEMDGKNLHASSVTKVPNKGFEILSVNYTSLKYREQDANDVIKEFQLQINRSEGCRQYTAAIQALNPSIETYIYDNPYQDVKPEDVDLHDDALEYQLLHHAPETEGISQMDLPWYTFNFYDRYRIIVYATDDNYKDFFMTYQQVMEMDGNFHEAKFNIEGDGIGVFGSVIADTVYVEVAK